ncbi:uncharacterized protein MONBRDRAFT_33221 [Monosiga brevicollis MX1]|uniref:Malic enzyme n=1 Tax=Monosiga brevicollis TaxID=81824 RepID=A9V485_MONBE|nr:uncharacterized protein MONBRDRAFT_33221 [Monosiga brevicollis MX1]EDQ87574.1 predicted protein [Monosiga brevicollis MX1]|eukprot:XP_001747494.1 hypothetical protein [Monosiga brevicollis MX1]
MELLRAARPGASERLVQAVWTCSVSTSHRRYTTFGGTREDSGPKATLRRIKPVVIPERTGAEIQHDPFYNKGTAFSEREKDRLGLRGLVPPVINTIEQQVARIYRAFHAAGHTSEEDKERGREEDVVAKHLFLMSLQDRNETLFFKLLTSRIEEMAPIIYTPTVGYACQNASTLFRRARGMYFTAADRGDMHAIIQNWPRNDVDVVVVTDGSRILGLGDLGVQGMGIPIGKLALYVAAGGIEPSRCLPVMIDVGTNNQKLLDDPFYMGLRQRRTEGPEYFELMDEFMQAVSSRFPRALVQFEDFKTPKAEQLLNRYRNIHTCFNDDMQGTGAVALAGLLAALRRNGEDLTRAKIVCVGAGSAGLGVCNMISDAMERQGLSRQEALNRFWLVDENGLLTARRMDKLAQGQIPFARYDSPSLDLDGASLKEVVDGVQPTILLGLSGVGGLFTEEVVKSMATHVEHPVIFAMSNPTNLSECTAEQVFEWTDGRVTFASGSPFGPVTRHSPSKGQEVTHQLSQANNMYIFPGLGLGIVAAQATTVTDHMLYVAARRLADCVSEEDLRIGKVFPRISEIREVSLRIAVAVAATAQEDGIARRSPQDRDWTRFIKEMMWVPEYAPIIKSNARITGSV